MTLKQSTSTVLMVRPASIGSNPETAASNAFQAALSPAEIESARASALIQFQQAVENLRVGGVDVVVIPDKPEPPRPDAVFPNNWFSTHPDGKLVLYPMLSPARRLERRPELIEWIKQQFGYWDVLDYTAFEHEGKFLEGTGSLVFDHPNRVAFACLSPRTHPDLVDRVCADLGYRPIKFTAEDPPGKPIYHTNVLMAVGTHLALVCMESIADDLGRMKVAEALDTIGRKTILLNREEMRHFAGNMLEVETTAGEKRLVMSTTAWLALRPDNKKIVADTIKPIMLPVGAIQQLGGGSARCMLAEIFKPDLSLKPAPEPTAEPAPEAPEAPLVDAPPTGSNVDQPRDAES